MPKFTKILPIVVNKDYDCVPRILSHVVVEIRQDGVQSVLQALTTHNERNLFVIVFERYER